MSEIPPPPRFSPPLRDTRRSCRGDGLNVGDGDGRARRWLTQKKLSLFGCARSLPELLLRLIRFLFASFLLFFLLFPPSPLLQNFCINILYIKLSDFCFFFFLSQTQKSIANLDHSLYFSFYSFLRKKKNLYMENDGTADSDLLINLIRRKAGADSPPSLARRRLSSEPQVFLPRRPPSPPCSPEKHPPRRGPTLGDTQNRERDWNNARDGGGGGKVPGAAPRPPAFLSPPAPQRRRRLFQPRGGGGSVSPRCFQHPPTHPRVFPGVRLPRARLRSPGGGLGRCPERGALLWKPPASRASTPPPRVPPSLPLP